MNETETLLRIKDKLSTFQLMLEEETNLSPAQLEDTLLTIQKDLLANPTLVEQLEVEEVTTMVDAMKQLAKTPLPTKKTKKSRKVEPDIESLFDELEL